MGKMDGMVALVTGASRGLGRAISQRVRTGGRQRRYMRPEPIAHRAGWHHR